MVGGVTHASDRDNYCVHASFDSDKSETKVSHHAVQSQFASLSRTTTSDRGLGSRECPSAVVLFLVTVGAYDGSYLIDDSSSGGIAFFKILAECRHHASTCLRVRVASSRRSTEKGGV